MSLLSNRRMLAVATIVDVAIHARPAPVAAKALAERFSLPPRHLETLLQALVRANILKGVRGPKGGYELARERRRITLGDIVRAVSSEEAETSPGPALIAALVAPAIAEAEAEFLGKLDHLTIAELCLRAEAALKPGLNAVTADFTI